MSTTTAIGILFSSPPSPILIVRSRNQRRFGDKILRGELLLALALISDLLLLVVLGAVAPPRRYHRLTLTLVVARPRALPPLPPTPQPNNLRNSSFPPQSHPYPILSIDLYNNNLSGPLSSPFPSTTSLTSTSAVTSSPTTSSTIIPPRSSSFPTSPSPATSSSDPSTPPCPLSPTSANSTSATSTPTPALFLRNPATRPAPRRG